MAVVVIVISQSDSILPQKGDILGIIGCIHLLCQLFSSLVKGDSFSPDHLCILCHSKAEAAMFWRSISNSVVLERLRKRTSSWCSVLNPGATMTSGRFLPYKSHTHTAIKASLVELCGLSSRSKISVSIRSAWQISFKFQPSAGVYKNKSWCRNGVANNICWTAVRFVTHPQVPWAAPSLFSREECMCMHIPCGTWKWCNRESLWRIFFLLHVPPASPSLLVGEYSLHCTHVDYRKVK